MGGRKTERTRSYVGYINRDISLNYEAVIDEFGKFNRRLSFV